MKRKSFEVEHCKLHPDQKNLEIDPILKLPDVLRVTTLKKTALYNLMDSGSFPKQIRLGKRRVGWRQSAIKEWIDSRPYVDEVYQKRGE